MHGLNQARLPEFYKYVDYRLELRLSWALLPFIFFPSLCQLIFLVKSLIVFYFIIFIQWLSGIVDSKSSFHFKY